MAGQGSEIAGVAGPSAATLVISPARSGAAVTTAASDGDPSLAPGTVIDGRYRVTREIGAGGMGRVYEAEHMFLRRSMAIKLLRRGLATAPEATARLIQEAMLAGQVPHPAIVQVFDCAVLADGQVYLAMELLRGESLEQRLRRPGHAGEVVPLLAELARGLAAVHRVGVVHRDIKPANVFLANSDSGVQAKLLDFGVAKLLPGATAEAAVRTQAGAVLGTPYYLAPEQARGGSIDGRADLYALGVMLYETLTGTLPFLGDSFMAIVARHLHELPLDPRQAAPERGIPDGIARLTMRLLSKDPGLRASDGDALADELQALLGVEGAALGRVAIGGVVGGGAGARTVAPAAGNRLAEGTGAATRRVALQLAADPDLASDLASGTGAVTRTLDVGLAEGTGPATVQLGSGSMAEPEGRAPRVELRIERGADTLPLGSPLPAASGLSEGTAEAGPAEGWGWRGKWLAVGAALGVIVAGSGWMAARSMRVPEVEAPGRSEPVVVPGEAGVVEAPALIAAPPVAVPPEPATRVEAPAAAVVTKVEAPVKASPGPVKKPRPGKKKPSEGGTTQTPPPKTGGDPQLKPDVYDL